MPQTVVKGPDNKRYIVNHPDGASQEEIIAYAQKMAPSVQQAPAPVQEQPQGDPTKPGQYLAGLMTPGFVQGGKEMARNFLANIPAAGKVLEPLIGKNPLPPDTPEQQQEYQQYQQAHPVASEAGRLTARVGPGLIAGPASFAGQVGTNIGLSALEENPASAIGFGMTAPVLSGLAGVGKQAYNAFKGNLAPVENILETVKGAKLLNLLKEKGYALTPDVTSGTATKRIAAAQGHPLTKKIFEETAEHNQALYNETVAASMGTKITEFSDEGLGAIKAELAQKYDDIFGDVSAWARARAAASGGKHSGIQIPPKVGEKLKELDKGLYKELKNQLENGSIDGDTFRRLRGEVSEMTKLKKAKGRTARGLVDDLDDALEKQVPPSLIQKYKTVREQWRNYFSIESLKSQKARSAAGDVDPLSLQTKLRRTYKPGSKPHNPETEELLKETDGISNIKHANKPSGFVFARDAEVAEVGRPIEYASRLAPALLGASKVGANADDLRELVGRLSRTVLNPEVREKTPYYPSILNQ